MSDENVNIITEDTETTTRFKQAKTKVADFFKKHKTAIAVGVGSTAVIGLAAVVRSITSDDDDQKTITCELFDEDDNSLGFFELEEPLHTEANASEDGMVRVPVVMTTDEDGKITEVERAE